LVLANWDFVKEAEDQIPALFELFEIGKNGTIDFDKSYRPHILLFDEYYAEIYESEIAMDWVAEAETIIFMGTSNSVGITNMVLESALRRGKEVIVVDPNPAPSLRYPGIQIFEESAMDFSKRYF
jgi:NAD-dependent deacetylase